MVKEDGRQYVYAVLQSATQSKEDIDDLEFLFKVCSLVGSTSTQRSHSLPLEPIQYGIILTHEL